MRWIIPVLIFSGCGATMPPIQYDTIEPFTLFYRPLSEVRRSCPECSPTMVCYFRESKREMWVSWGSEWCFPHEMGHSAGWGEDKVRRIVGRDPRDLR